MPFPPVARRAAAGQLLPWPSHGLVTIPKRQNHAAGAARTLRHDVLAGFLILFTAVTAWLGAFGADVYRDNLLVRSGWHGNDLVTLLLATPLLTIGYGLSRRGSPRGTALWLGMLAYTLYNYAFYVFGAAFNQLFLVYVAILALSTLGLIHGLTSPEAQRVLRAAAIGRVERAVGMFVIMVSSVLGISWVAVSSGYLWTGTVPAMVRAVGHPTNVAGALDLWLVVSFGLLGGVWLWRRRDWGYLVAAIWTVKGAVYMTALSAASIAAFTSGAVDDLSQLGLWVPIGAGCAICSVLLLRSCPAGATRPDDGPAGAGSDR